MDDERGFRLEDIPGLDGIVRLYQDGLHVCNLRRIDLAALVTVLQPAAQAPADADLLTAAIDALPDPERDTYRYTGHRAYLSKDHLRSVVQAVAFHLDHTRYDAHRVAGVVEDVLRQRGFPLSPEAEGAIEAAIVGELCDQSPAHRAQVAPAFPAEAATCESRALGLLERAKDLLVEHMDCEGAYPVDCPRCKFTAEIEALLKEDASHA